MDESCPDSVSLLATLAVASGALALVHPTYALFVLIPLVGYVVARLVLVRTELAEGGLALAAIVVPAGAVALWLRPIARETVSVNPSDERAAPGRSGTTRTSSTSSPTGATAWPRRWSGAPGRSRSLALFAVPLAVLAARRRWGAFVIGGFLAVLVLMLWPTLFTHFSDVVSISQARRAAGFVPFPFAVAGAAAVLARLLALGALPVGLGGRASPSSSPTRATSATRSTTVVRRWRPGWPCSAPPRRWWSERSCRAG